MCLYPKFIRNKRYTMYNLRKGETICDDDRKLFVPIGCGNCIECRKQKAREWQIRLNEELKEWKYKYFVTLTFNADSLSQLCAEKPQMQTNVNMIAGLAVRRFLERYRKKYKHSLKHWLITELGHTNTERIHLHGVIFANDEISKDELNELWKYGYADNGQFCNERTIGYIIKYVTKIDIDHKTYKPDIFCSAGIGANYVNNEFNKHKHRFREKDTIETYTMPDGKQIALPIYYRNKLWTQNERDKLWTQTLDKDRRFVRGIEVKKISTEEGYSNLSRLLHAQQQDNIALGFGDRSAQWQEKDYKVTLDMLKKGKIVKNEEK